MLGIIKEFQDQKETIRHLIKDYETCTWKAKNFITILNVNDLNIGILNCFLLTIQRTDIFVKTNTKIDQSFARKTCQTPIHIKCLAMRLSEIRNIKTSKQKHIGKVKFKRVINRNTCQSFSGDKDFIRQYFSHYSCITAEKHAYDKKVFPDESNLWSHRSCAKVSKLEQKYLTKHLAETWYCKTRRLCPLFYLNYTKLVKMLCKKKKINQNTFSMSPNRC